MISTVCLLEGKTSIVKRNTASKRKALAGSTAMQIAKQKSPSMYRMYMKHNLIRKQLKSKIQKVRPEFVIIL